MKSKRTKSLTVVLLIALSSLLSACDDPIKTANDVFKATNPDVKVNIFDIKP